MAETYLNNNYGLTLGANMTNVATTLTTTAVALSGGFRILIDTEIMTVTSGATTSTWTVVRGAEGTTATTHLQNAQINLVLTADALQNILLQSNKLTLSYVPVYANNAAALAGALTAGCLYRTGSDPDTVCIVH